MIVIIIVYLSLQLASTLFLFFQLPQRTELVTHMVLATLAVLSYLAAHFRTVPHRPLSQDTPILKC